MLETKRSCVVSSLLANNPDSEFAFWRLQVCVALTVRGSPISDSISMAPAGGMEMEKQAGLSCQRVSSAPAFLLFQADFPRTVAIRSVHHQNMPLQKRPEQGHPLSSVNGALNFLANEVCCDKGGVVLISTKFETP